MTTVKQLIDMLKDVDEHAIVYHDYAIESLLKNDNTKEEDIISTLDRFTQVIIKSDETDDVLSNHLIAQTDSDRILILY